MYSKKNDTKTAIKCFKKAIEYNYGDYFAHFYLAEEYKKNGEVDFALNEYRKVLELSPDYSWAYFNVAQIYWELDRVDDAVVMLLKTIEKNPKDIEAYKLLVQIYIKQNKLEEALEVLTSASDIAENGDIYYLMARVFELMEDEKSYKDCLELAIENRKTLTFNLKSIQQEYKNLK